MAGVYAQEAKLKVKITTLDNVTTEVEGITTSSSSGCMSADFPVYQGTDRVDVHIGDLRQILVRHDLPAEDVNNYITLELIDKEGKSKLVEIIKSIRFIGKSESGNYSAKVKDINSVLILD
jgi:hypothetical protein